MLRNPHDFIEDLVGGTDQNLAENLTPEQLRARSAPLRGVTGPRGYPFGDGYVSLDLGEPPRRSLLDAILDGRDEDGR